MRNEAQREIHLARYLGRRTLILGDVNTGKTSLCRAILQQMCRHGMASEIAVVDLAPEIPESVVAKHGLTGVGGKLLPPPKEDVVYLNVPLSAPRLSSTNEAEALEKAKRNARAIEGLFKQYLQLERGVLFINDISMALQVGSADELNALLNRSETVVANGYYGAKLAAGKLSQWERRQMSALKSFFHQIIFTQSDLDSSDSKAGHDNLSSANPFSAEGAEES